MNEVRHRSYRIKIGKLKLLFQGLLLATQLVFWLMKLLILTLRA